MSTGLTVGVETAPPARRGRIRPSWYLVAALGAMAIISLVRVLTGATDLTSSGTMEAALTAAVPLALAGLGGLWAERAGVVNIGLEGMMILGTWGAGWAGWQWGPWAALVGGAVGGALGGLLHAVATVTFAVNHIVSGVAITLLGLGVTKYLASLVFVPLTQNP
ncbi:ABC transporter permease subunit, partial [Actinophytocola sp.]|uniref:ABC transporter permease subunit n=1 Tax=Actinophytocola sp. TaxID=1872138 RepID=UPI002DB4EA00|nr:ABC transporter permease [Actinophytocola sp.]